MYVIEIWNDSETPEVYECVLRDFALKAALQGSRNGNMATVTIGGSMVAVFENGELVQDS